MFLAARMQLFRLPVLHPMHSRPLDFNVSMPSYWYCVDAFDVFLGSSFCVIGNLQRLRMGCNLRVICGLTEISCLVHHGASLQYASCGRLPSLFLWALCACEAYSEVCIKLYKGGHTFWHQCSSKFGHMKPSSNAKDPKTINPISKETLNPRRGTMQPVTLNPKPLILNSSN